MFIFLLPIIFIGALDAGILLLRFITGCNCPILNVHGILDISLREEEGAGSGCM